MSPACGPTSPAMGLSSGVLPAPLAPMSATTSPGSTRSETPWSARTPAPYATWTSRASSKLAGATAQPGDTALPSGTALAEIRANHLRVAHDRLGRAVGDLEAVVQHDHSMGKRHDDLHHVLHHADRHLELLVDPPDQLHGGRGLERREPGHGLVQQQ